jgi:hypothetical protein
MIESVADLRRVAVHDRQGRIGFVEQVFFDDRHWAIRFLVVDAGPERGDRRLLLPPAVVAGHGRVPRAPRSVRLVRPPVDRGPQGRDSAADIPVRAVDAPARAASGSLKEGEAQLCSSREMVGYRVSARDGRIGHVEDLLYDGTSWSIRFVLVDARNWIDGGWLLVPPQLVRARDGETRTLTLDASVGAVLAARPVEGVRRHVHSSTDAPRPPRGYTGGQKALSRTGAEGRELPWKR